MSTKLVEDIAAAVLYEGYILYPYRATSVKNRQRWNFGVLYPRSYAEAQTGSDAWSMQTECLAQASAGAVVTIQVRFLHLLCVDGWQQAMERKLHLTHIVGAPPTHDSFAFEPIETQQPVQGAVEIISERTQAGMPVLKTPEVFRIGVRIENATPFSGAGRDGALMQSMISTHAILSIEGGEWISLLEPPAEMSALAASCRNQGAWPVLVGEPGQRDTMLASPIILYDYPQIAPESPGALFDGTEIDEILTLRILTLTDEEKREMVRDERAREILERTEAMPAEQFMKLHGVMRSLR